MNDLLNLAILVVFSYLLGSIPSAYIAGKIKRGVDIRKVGSGNVGATNTLVSIGPLFGAGVYLFDLFKGLIPVLIAKKLIGTDVSMGIAGLAAVLGHDFSIFLRFTGGKGVATTTGAIFGIHAMIMWIVFAFWLLLVAITNLFILSSLICLLLVPILFYLFKLSYICIAFGAIYFIIGLYTHRQDIAKIASGKEKKAFRSIKKFFSKQKF